MEFLLNGTLQNERREGSVGREGGRAGGERGKGRVRREGRDG